MGTWKENLSEVEVSTQGGWDCFSFKEFFQAEVDVHPNRSFSKKIKSCRLASKELAGGQCLRDAAKVHGTAPSLAVS